MFCLAAAGLAWTVSSGVVTVDASAAAAGVAAGPGTAARGPAVTSLAGRPVAVSTLLASDAWAVEGTNRVLRWNGTSWAQMVLPEYGTGSFLDAVDAVSATNAWAAHCYDTTSSQCRALLEHWNGSTWTRVPSPAFTRLADTAAARTRPTETALTGTFLQGVSGTSASSAWAVGYDVVASPPVFSVSVILHWNGTRGAQLATPNPGYTSNTLSAVAAVSPSRAWAAGSYDVFKPAGAIPIRTLLLQWNGTRWRRVTTPNPGADLSTLNGVAASSGSNAWAVGSYQLPPSGGTISSKTLMLRWDGTAWARS